MATPGSANRAWRFGVFEVDTHRVELRRNGTTIKLRDQPFQILVHLLEHAGEIVSREELRQVLWPSGTFVDFDHSLSMAVMNLRDTLGDSSETPLYIETIPKRGYRFIAPVTTAPDEPNHNPMPDSDGAPHTESTASAQPVESRPAESNGKHLRNWILLAGAMAFIGVSTTAIWYLRRPLPPPRIDSIAVLPFENLSGDPSQEYFADGMTEELITELGSFGSFRVISRTSVMRLKRAGRPLPEIAHQLGADGIVEGTVTRSGNHVRITANFLHAATDRHLWANSYESELEDVLVVQGKVARSVADAIRTELTRQGQLPTAAPRRVNPEAYQAYLQGRYHYGRLTFDGLSKAEASLRRSVELDPTFAPAYSAMASLYSMLAIIGLRPPVEVQPLAKAAALEAVRLDDQLAEAHTALGVVKQGYDWDWAGAEQEHKRALLLNPSSAEAHQWYATFLTAMGRSDEAIREGREAVRLDPVSLFPNLNLGWTLYFAHRHDDSISQLNKVLELDPQFAWANMELGWNYAKKGMYREAVAECQRALNIMPDNQVILGSCGRIFGQAGRRQDAVAHLARLEALAQKGYVNPCTVADLYDGVADTDHSIEWLQWAYKERSTSVLFLKVEFSDRLHSDPRFQALLRKLNFPS